MAFSTFSNIVSEYDWSNVQADQFPEISETPLEPPLLVVAIDPLHVMSRGACSCPHWRTTEAILYGETIQRPPLPLICKECRHQFFSIDAVCLTTHSVL